MIDSIQKYTISRIESADLLNPAFRLIVEDTKTGEFVHVSEHQTRECARNYVRDNFLEAKSLKTLSTLPAGW